MARHGVRSLADIGGVIAGVVLNAVDLDRHEYKYYYHYYSYKRDGYYSSHQPAGRTEVRDDSEAERLLRTRWAEGCAVLPAI